MRRACPQLDWGTRPHRHRLVSHEPCRSLDTPSVEKELARAGRRPRRATAGCSFGTRRGSPARDTLGPRRGAMQGSIAARITRTANVRWHATAPTRARPRAGRRSLAGTAPRATPPSACCRTVWPRGCRANSMTSKRWWRMPSGPRAAAQRPMRCAATRWGSRARYAGSSAECCWSTTPCASSSGCCPSSSSDASPRWARCAPGSEPTAPWSRYAH